MKVTILPSEISGILQAPISKSYTQRALAAALLTDGMCRIQPVGKSDDELAALQIIEELGASIHFLNKGILEIKSKFLSNPSLKSKEVNCQESGLSFRMFAFIISLLDEEIILKRAGTLKKRDMSFFADIFRQLNISFKEHHHDFYIKGPLIIKDIEIDGSASSQYLTGMLFAFSKSLQMLSEKGIKRKVMIKVNHLKSKPYIDLTLKVMSDFGMLLPENKNYEAFVFDNSEWRKKEYISIAIETDWSNAAFLMVAAAVSGELTIKGLDVFSKQADKKILEALQDCGCILSISLNEISIKKNYLKAFHFNAVDCPDLFPPLVALAAHCSGTSVIEGVHRLFHKESNRAESLIEEFQKIGIEIKIQDDHMIIAGGKIKSASTTSHSDHRIVMAIAVAALGGNEKISISDASAVSKSYPDFFRDLETVEACIQILN